MAETPEPPDEETTKVECPKCGGDRRQECTLCKGQGSVTAAESAFWKAGKLASGSGEHRILVPKRG